eukprot:7318643-Prymnesium_polylepis.1
MQRGAVSAARCRHAEPPHSAAAVARAPPHIVVQAEALRPVSLRVVPRRPRHHERAPRTHRRLRDRDDILGEDVVDCGNDEACCAQRGGPRARRHNRVRVQPHALPEAQCPVAECLVDSADVLCSVHPQELLGGNVGTTRLAHAQAIAKLGLPLGSQRTEQ